MAIDTKADDMLDELRDAYTRQIRQALTELPAHHALQLADALCLLQLDVLAGLRIVYRASPGVDRDAIIESWRRGLSLAEVMNEHGVSRSMAYKCHPSKAAQPA